MQLHQRQETLSTPDQLLCGLREIPISRIMKNCSLLSSLAESKGFLILHGTESNLQKVLLGKGKLTTTALMYRSGISTLNTFLCQRGKNNLKQGKNKMTRKCLPTLPFPQGTGNSPSSAQRDLEPSYRLSQAPLAILWRFRSNPRRQPQLCTERISKQPACSLSGVGREAQISSTCTMWLA